MTYRNLRIAWTVIWGLAAVLLCVLRVRSYCYIDVLQKFSTSRLFIISSSKGRPAYFENRASPQSAMPPEEIAPIIDDFILRAAKPILGFGRVRGLRIPPLLFAPLLVSRSHFWPTFRNPLATMVVKPILPPHSANRNDAGSRGAGADRVLEPELNRPISIVAGFFMRGRMGGGTDCSPAFLTMGVL
jgi:hypothetical protein